MAFWLLCVAALVLLGGVILAAQFWVMRRNDRKAAGVFPHDEDAQATYALLRDLEGFGNPHWLSRAFVVRRRRESERKG